MIDNREPVFHISPDKEFIDRKVEIDNIYKLALATSANTTQSLYLKGKRKIGKTEVLKRVYNRLFWEQGRVIPFYYCFYKEFSDILEFAKDYLTEFAKQYLGFIKKQPFFIRKNISLNKILGILEDEEYPKLKELIENYYEYAIRGDCLDALKNSIIAPCTLSLEGFEKVFVILDDFHRTKYIKSSEIKSGLLGEFSKILNNRCCPHIITGYSVKMLNEIFSGENITGKCDIMTLNGLKKDDACILFKNLCELFNIKFLKENVNLMANHLALNPFYIKSFIRSAQRMGVSMYSLKDFQKLYIYEVTAGNIGFYFSSILDNFLQEEEKRLAIKILKTCVDAPKGGLTGGIIADAISSDLPKTSKVLVALQEGNLLEMDFSRIKGIHDPVLRDYISFIYFTMIEGQEPSVVNIRMISDGLKALSKRGGQKISEDLKIMVENILNSFDCQRIPKILFDWKKFISQYGKESFKEVSEKLINEKEFFPLPQVIGVTESSSNIRDIAPEKIFLFGYGFDDGSYEEDSEILWVCAIFFSPSVIRVNEVEEFERRVDEIRQTSGNFKIGLWLVAKDGFTDGAAEKLNKNGIKYSDMNQLYHLKYILFEKKDDSKFDMESGLANSENEFELVIPMASNTELVAVKAIEEIALRVDFDQDSINQIKMALIEACINATEHSKIKGGKIIMKFIINYDKLTIYICNEGESFNPSSTLEADRDKNETSSSSRGWGIKLMKNFMDEVKFEKLNGGTKLKMVKHLRKKSPPHA